MNDEELINVPRVTLEYDYFENLRAKELSPENRLLLAVLEDGVYFAVRPERGAICRESREWIERDDMEAFSFLYVCEWLNLDPGYLRRGLRSLPEYQLPVKISPAKNPRGKWSRSVNPSPRPSPQAGILSCSPDQLPPENNDSILLPAPASL